MYTMQSVIIADRLYPSQIDITYDEFRLAKGRFLKVMKSIHPLELNAFFEENYFSRDNIAWFILGEVRYFLILLNIGTVMEEHYYGKQIVFFNP